MQTDVPYKLTWTLAAWEDYTYWQGQDKRTLKRINALLKDTLRQPFDGIGKPEPLKENLSGFKGLGQLGGLTVKPQASGEFQNL